MLLQVDREDDESWVPGRWQEAPAAAIAKTETKMPRPHLQSKLAAVALTAKFDYWRTFSSTAAVIALSKLPTRTIDIPPRTFLSSSTSVGLESSCRRPSQRLPPRR
jgi:hypothetical protein